MGRTGSSRSASRRRSPPRRCARPSRSRSRSRRRSPPGDRRESRGADGAGPGEGGPRAEVVESEARQSTGEQTYRAEIHMPKMMRYNYDGKSRTMAVRGPPRVDREQAKRDAAELEREAAKGDTSSVKALARSMLRSNVA
mmetsp:Transcript_34616/g.103452  ORF Transcript_34616/g.103452 Transcript_34616/m.103452 type:complete len:140 (-) Transcript_34616:180-599(-)